MEQVQQHGFRPAERSLKLSSFNDFLKSFFSFFASSAAQQSEEAAEEASSTDAASTTAATGVTTATQGRAITTVTQSTPTPGPSVPVRLTTCFHPFGLIVVVSTILEQQHIYQIM